MNCNSFTKSLRFREFSVLERGDEEDEKDGRDVHRDAQKIGRREVPMLPFGLMTEDEHGGVTAERPAEEREQKQRLLLRAIGTLLGLALIGPIGDEGDEGKQDQIAAVSEQNNEFGLGDVHGYDFITTSRDENHLIAAKRLRGLKEQVQRLLGVPDQ